jgi:hypothetical protein
MDPNLESFSVFGTGDHLKKMEKLVLKKFLKERNFSTPLLCFLH